MNRRLSTSVMSAVLSTVLVAGCTGSPDTPPARETAVSLAAALSSGDLAAVPFAGPQAETAQQWWDDTLGALGATPPTVSVDEVEESEDATTATATLSYEWKIEGAEWAYDTTVSMSRSEGNWTVEQTPELIEPSLQPGEVLEVAKAAAPRGDILGAGGSKLVTERPVRRFGIDRTQVPAGRAATSAAQLARLVGIDPNAYAKRVAAAGEKAFVEAIALRTYDVPARVREGYPIIKGAVSLKDEMPLAVNRDFARPILGTVGPVTAEMIEKSEEAYSIGDEAGLSGLQLRYEEQLRGTPGVTVQAVQPDSDDSRDLFTAEAEAGEPLRTTLDERHQLVAEELLSDVRPASALVAIRPSDGAVLAAASGAGSNGYSTATVGTYAPGSTFKVVSSLALLRAGLEPTTTVSCPPTVVVDGKRFKNYDDYPATALGQIPLRTAVANSCNTAFISQRDDVSQGDLVEAAAALGLGEDHDTGFPSYFGSVPDSATETGHAAAMIGQGEVLASPLSMAVVAASVKRGSAVVPTLITDQRSSADPAKPLTADEAAALREMMRAVVTEGSGSFLATVPGAPVLAKTGTAEFGTETPPKTHAWMIAVHGDLAVAAFVDVGDSGSGTAGPLLEEFLRRAG